MNAVLAIVFLDLLGAGLVMPILPFAAQSFGASSWMIGLFASLFPAMQALSSPAWGRFADRKGRRPAMLLSVFGNFVAYVIFIQAALSHSLPLLLLSRALSGAASGSLVVAKAYIADVSKVSDLPKRMGYFGAAQALGFLFGPAIGGAFSSQGFLYPAGIAAGFSALSLAWGALTLEEPARERDLKRATTARPWQDILGEQGFWAICVQAFLMTFSLSHIFVTFPLFIQQTLGYGGRENGYYFVALSIVAIAVQGVLYAKVARYFAHTTLYRVGLVLTATGMIFCSNLPGPGGALLLLLFVAVGFSLCTPALLSLVAAKADPSEQGVVSGLTESFAAAARTLGPISAGVLIQVGGPKVSFATAGAFALLTSVFSKSLRGERIAR